jgi:hypothetical protein
MGDWGRTMALRASFAAAFALGGISADAQTTGSLTLNSQPGDPIGGGQLLQYDGTNATYSTQSDGSTITVNVFPSSGGVWTVNLAAPPGQTMAVGAYENAVRASFRPPGTPGIDVYGMGIGCNTTSGRFDVTEISFGPNNYVIAFSASFEQHCESPYQAPLYGDVHVQNPPPPPALTLGLSLSQAVFNKVTGAAAVNGTLTCNKAADVGVNLVLTQRISRTQVMRGSSFQSLHCEAPGASVALVVNESSGGAFVKGRPVEIAANLSAFDPAYGSFVTATSTQVLKLK